MFTEVLVISENVTADTRSGSSMVEKFLNELKYTLTKFNAEKSGENTKMRKKNFFLKFENGNIFRR